MGFVMNSEMHASKRPWVMPAVTAVWLVLSMMVFAMPTFAQESSDLVNLDHLKYLTEPVTIDGHDMALVHIYAEYPGYKWVDAASEGLAAVDDVARAAVIFMWEYERTGDESLLDLARRSLEFVLYMQADDGEFYNFVYDDAGTINERGNTSFKSLGWWAMRGLWSLGEGVRVFDPIDAAFADRLAEAYLKTERAIADTMSNYGEYTELHGFKIPAWIPASEPSVAGVGLLGMAAYYEARPNEATADTITKIADGMAEYRLGTHDEYPFGLHPTRSNAPGFWHNWGAHMPHALVVAGMALDRPDWIESARATADSFLLRHLALEPFRDIGVVPDRLEQIAYGTNQIVLTYTSLYEATGEDKYARLAGLAASWYFGNNMAGVQMYDPASGRVFDGLNGPAVWRLNRNSGAESTIEGLMSMIALAEIPLAQDYLHVEPQPFTSYRVLQAEDGDRVVGTPTYYSGNWTGEGYISAGRYVGIGEGQRMRLQFEIKPEDAGEYLLYVAHLRQASGGSQFTIPQAADAPTIDGDDADWPDSVPTLDANTARQFLRGAGVWDGPEVDSFSVKLQWDAENLYLYASVIDPVHEQNSTVSSVWQGDTLWLYFTNTPDARTLSAKFTLAETPSGPQIWDWLKTEFARGGTLAWTPMADGRGYRYEAAIPWATIDVEAPAAGTRIGFEAGRGIGGNSFLDLTGRDPDIAANLLQLTLVTPESGLDLAAAPDVALAVRIDREDETVIQESVSPDSDYFWLDKVTSAPVRLEAGEHTIRYEYAGEEGASNPGVSKVDAFYLQPAVAQRSFVLADGRTVTLTYDTVSGESTWEETK